MAVAVWVRRVGGRARLGVAVRARLGVVVMARRGRLFLKNGGN